MDDTSFHISDYFKPKSLTWWSGVIAVGVGFALSAGLDHPSLGAVGQLLAALGGGDASPAALIFMGTGLIGIRAKLGRA